MLFLCFSFRFTSMPHALLPLFISVQCMAMLFCTSLPFCHRHAVTSCLPSFPFHGYAWCMPLPHATTHQNLLEHSSVDLIQTCKYNSSSIKDHKCQPENSSLVLLVFLHQSHQTTPDPLLVPWTVAPWSFSCLTIVLVASRPRNLVPLTVTSTMIVPLLEFPKVSLMGLLGCFTRTKL